VLRAAVTINESAPVAAAGEIEVAAEPELVWDVLTALDRWRSWNPDVKAMAFEGEVAEGATFHWRPGPRMIASTFGTVERPRLLTWAGRSPGVKAMRVWRLQEWKGGTLVGTRESWEGLLPSLLRGRMQRMLQRDIDKGLGHLKAEAERQAAETI
jgi:uncharacterized protein YndB with AHSA1/START domain